MSQSAASGALADLRAPVRRPPVRSHRQAPAAERAGPGGPGPAPRRCWTRRASWSRRWPSASAVGAAAHRRDADHRQLPGRAADGPLHARAPGRRGDAGGGQHRGDRAPGGQLRDRRRPHRGRDRAPAIWRSPRGATTSWWSSARPTTRSRASARSTDEDLRERVLDRPRARLRDAAGLRPRHARAAARPAHRAGAAAHRGHQGRGGGGTGHRLHLAHRPARTPSRTGRCTPAASRSGTSAGSSSSCSPRTNPPAPASRPGSRSADRRPSARDERATRLTPTSRTPITRSHSRRPSHSDLFCAAHR